MANAELILCDYEGCNKPFSYRVSGFNLCAEHCEFGKGVMTIVENKLIAELEAKLAALDWTPITAGNLPQVGIHEVLRSTGFVKRCSRRMLAWGAWAYSNHSWTHFRPINPPQEPK